MVPCCRLYGFLGVKLKQEKQKAEEEEEKKRAGTDSNSTPKPKKNPFSAWIETYSSHEYHAATGKLEALLDRLAEGLSAEQQGEFFHFFVCFGGERVFLFGPRELKRCARRLLSLLLVPAKAATVAAHP